MNLKDYSQSEAQDIVNQNQNSGEPITVMFFVLGIILIGILLIWGVCKIVKKAESQKRSVPRKYTWVPPKTIGKELPIGSICIYDHERDINNHSNCPPLKSLESAQIKSEYRLQSRDSFAGWEPDRVAMDSGTATSHQGVHETSSPPNMLEKNSYHHSFPNGPPQIEYRTSILNPPMVNSVLIFTRDPPIRVNETVPVKDKP